MPVKTITAEINGKVRKVTMDVPDGATEQDIMSALESYQEPAAPAKKPEKTVSGFAGNVLTSAANLAGNTAAAIMHPLDTLSTLGSIPVGLYEKAGGPVPQGWSYESSKTLDKIGQNYKNRYGSLSQIGDTLYEDPVGVAADASMALGAAGAAAKLGGATKAATTLSAASDTINPVSAAIRGTGNATKAALQSNTVNNLGKRIYQSSLKPRFGSDKVSPADIAQTVQTGLSEAIPVTEKGLSKLQGLIDDYNQTIQGKIDAGTKAGAAVDPAKVVTRLDDVETRFANQVDNASDLNEVASTGVRFLDQNPGMIPASKAQAMKIGTYQKLRGAYSEVSSAAKEAQKALARGLKEELANLFPELTALNAKEGAALQLENALQHAVKRISNRENLPIGSATLSFIKSIADSPTVKSHLAIAMHQGAKRQNLGKAAASSSPARMAPYISRINQILDSLQGEIDQSQGSVPMAQGLAR